MTSMTSMACRRSLQSKTSMTSKTCRSFGLGPEKPSYEEAWTLGGLKLDVFSADEVEAGWWRLPLWIQVSKGHSSSFEEMEVFSHSYWLIIKHPLGWLSI